MWAVSFPWARGARLQLVALAASERIQAARQASAKPLDIMAAINGCTNASKACAILCPRLLPGCPRYARADPRTGGSDSGPARRPLVAGQHVRQTLTNFRTCLLQTGAKVCLTFEAPIRQVWENLRARFLRVGQGPFPLPAGPLGPSQPEEGTSPSR